MIKEKTFTNALCRNSDNKRQIEYARKNYKEKGRGETQKWLKYAEKCHICGESRTVEICHIIPRYMNGCNELWNLIALCPTHHVVFDRCIMTDEEFDKVADKLRIAYSTKH